MQMNIMSRKGQLLATSEVRFVSVESSTTGNPVARNIHSCCRNTLALFSLCCQTYVVSRGPVPSLALHGNAKVLGTNVPTGLSRVEVSPEKKSFFACRKQLLLS